MTAAEKRIKRRSRKDSKDAKGKAFPQYDPSTLARRKRKGIGGSRPNLSFSGDMWKDFTTMAVDIRKHSVVVVLGLPPKYDRRVRALAAHGFYWLQMTPRQLRRLATDLVKAGILKLKKR